MFNQSIIKENRGGSRCLQWTTPYILIIQYNLYCRYGVHNIKHFILKCQDSPNYSNLNDIYKKKG